LSTASTIHELMLRYIRGGCFTARIEWQAGRRFFGPYTLNIFFLSPRIIYCRRSKDAVCKLKLWRRTNLKISFKKFIKL
jgi:hypothetical protein